jgi:hypothetical protein
MTPDDQPPTPATDLGALVLRVGQALLGALERDWPELDTVRRLAADARHVEERTGYDHRVALLATVALELDAVTRMHHSGRLDAATRTLRGAVDAWAAFNHAAQRGPGW